MIVSTCVNGAYDRSRAAFRQVLLPSKDRHNHGSNWDGGQSKRATNFVYTNM
jgi:hypothetical protein